MYTMINNFIADETGAITVDWVVLTAFLLTMTLSIVTVVASGLNKQSNNMTPDVTISTNF